MPSDSAAPGHTVPAGPVSGPPVVVDGLVKRFGAAVAVGAVDLRIAVGEVFGLVGPARAGKTTIVRLLLGMVRPSGGTVRVFGGQATCPDIRGQIGYLPARLQADPRYTLRDLLDFHAVVRGRHDPAWVDELLDRFAVDPDAGLGRLNPLRRRAAGIVTAVAHRPRLLVLDEPTGSLDPLLRRQLWRLVGELVASGTAVLVASRTDGEVHAFADGIGFLEHGRMTVCRGGRTTATASEYGLPAGRR